ncbi:hypothetical protein OS493_018919 [Desmophyllum pertusum]|uniref:Fibronectin type-III domain-containing protein n=1 Tax=Desmophyllum pertusum TaxID=174260 RepID=A0A9X0CR53_9CNID|nr:hypothetical protein OS493_018919 [Desmophyllum pertusum]
MDPAFIRHNGKQLYSRDWFSCIQACQDEPRCISYNYERSAHANGLCELNDCGVEDLCDRDKSLIYSVGFVFQQIRESNDENKCSLDKPVPTAPPQNVTVVNKTSTSIFITWDAVPPNQRSGEILGYKVSYTFRKKPARMRTVGAQTIYTNLTVLQKFRRYNITVMAYNQHGDGPPSKALRVRTDEDIPNGHPRNLTAVNKTSTSILVTWDEVLRGKREGHIDKYKMFSTAPTGEGGHSQDCSFKDPNSCFHYFCCDSGGAVRHKECSPTGTEFTNSSAPGDTPCSNPSEPYCSV